MRTAESAPCEPLEWDTAFFGFRIARARYELLTPQRVCEIDDWCRERRIDCLYFLSRCDDAETTRLTEENDFRLVDIRITFRHTLVWLPEPAGSVSEAKADHMPVLEAIAGTSYQESRFYYDTRFPRHFCACLYKTWIRRSFEGYADVVLVREQAGAPVGFISCHLDRADRVGRIGLIGVDSGARGTGAGRSLVGHALRWFQSQGAREAITVTQARNIVAQRLFQACGFLTHDVGLW